MLGNLPQASSRPSRPLAKTAAKGGKGAKAAKAAIAVKADRRLCLSVSQLMVRLRVNEDADCGLGLAMIDGENKNEQLTKFSDVMTSIYVAPIGKIKELEKKLGGGSASETIAECLKEIMKENESGSDSDEKKNEGGLTYDLTDVYDAGMNYIDKCESKLNPTKMSEYSLQATVSFGSYKEAIDILLSDFIDWVCVKIKSLDKIRWEKVAEFYYPKMEQIQKLLKKYVAEIVLSDKKWEVLTNVKIAGSGDEMFMAAINVHAIMKKIKEDAFFAKQNDNSGTLDNVLQLFKKWKQYITRMKRIPLTDLEKQLNKYARGEDSEMRFLKSSVSKGSVNEQQASDSIERCLNSIQDLDYEKSNQQLECSNRLNAVILAHLAFVEQNKEIPIELFVEKLLLVIASVKVDYDKYICVGCHEEQAESNEFCCVCGLDKIEFVQN